MTPLKRKIAIPNYYGEGKHVYEDQLGWRPYEKEEAGSVVSKDIFYGSTRISVS